MATILATVTEDARLYWPQFFGTLLGVTGGATVPGVEWNPLIKWFRVGEGGWIDPGSGKVKRDPDPSLRLLVAPFVQALDAEVDVNRGVPRYPADSRAVFEKALIPADFSFIAPSTIRIRCLLDFGDFNDDGFGNDPEIWELGLFSEHPTVAGQKLMVAYGTFPQETKNVTKQIENAVRIVF